MTKRVIFTEKAPKPIGPYSQAILVPPGWIFISGQIPINPKTGEIVGNDIKTQTRQVLENIKAILNAVGASMEDVVKVTVFLKNIKMFPDFNQVYAKYFKKDPPARTTVEVSNLPKGVLIEIDAIVYKEGIKI